MDQHELILRRTGLVCVPFEKAGDVVDEKVLTGLELAASKLGYALSADLRAALKNSGLDYFVPQAHAMLTTLSALRGMNVAHHSLFKNFPANLPADTHEQYIKSQMALMANDINVPCLTCDNTATQLMDPCGHAVCTECFDIENMAGCPACGQALSLDSHTLHVEKSETNNAHLKAPELLGVCRDVDASLEKIARKLLLRTAPLSPRDQADLIVLIHHFGESILDLAPEKIAVRETNALVLGLLLSVSENPAQTAEKFKDRIQTATDLLRVLTVWMGADAGLVEPLPRRRGMNRPLRRAVMIILENMPLDRLAEDLLRHRGRWVKMGEALRPFEFHNQFPETSTAFANLRKTPIDPTSPLGKTIAKVVGGQDQDANVKTMTRVRLRSHASLVETAIRLGNLAGLMDLLKARPGDFARRYDHLARVILDVDATFMDQFHAAFEEIVDEIPTPLLLTLRGHLRTRITGNATRRVFFPKGSVTRAYGMVDAREALPQEVVGPAVLIITRALQKRAGNLTPIHDAIIDEALADLLVPQAEKTASEALVQVPRGSTLPIPEGDKMRLFLHWTQPENLVIDLDLSVAFFDADWAMKAKCDYTQLSSFGTGARHSGDYTSAPAPNGASEFVDLDFKKLQEHGIRHAVMMIYSYSNIEFDKMNDAFAGFMSMRDETGATFDARTVEQRFDLTGNAKQCMPLIIDLETREMTWVDVKQEAGDGAHSVALHANALGKIACDLSDFYKSGSRPTLFEVAALHAGMRSNRVQVRRRDGSVDIFVKAKDELAEQFTDRIVMGNCDSQEKEAAMPKENVFAALVRADMELPENTTLYCLHRDVALPETSLLLESSDLVSEIV